MNKQEALDIYNLATNNNIKLDFIEYSENDLHNKCVKAIMSVSTMYKNLGGYKLSRQIIALIIFNITTK